VFFIFVIEVLNILNIFLVGYLLLILLKLSTTIEVSAKPKNNLNAGVGEGGQLVQITTTQIATGQNYSCNYVTSQRNHTSDRCLSSSAKILASIKGWHFIKTLNQM